MTPAVRHFFYLTMKTEHVLATSVGPVCNMTFDEDTGEINCKWTPHLDGKELVAAVTKEYLPWRNGILKDWSERTGRPVMVFDL